jgi:hypothetical protein
MPLNLPNGYFSHTDNGDESFFYVCDPEGFVIGSGNDLDELHALAWAHYRALKETA